MTSSIDVGLDRSYQDARGRPAGACRYRWICKFVTKIPEGDPRRGIRQPWLRVAPRELSGRGRPDGYGGRLGDDQKFGFLVNGSWDQENRVIDHVEPSWMPTEPDLRVDGQPISMSRIAGPASPRVPEPMEPAVLRLLSAALRTKREADYRVTPTSTSTLRACGASSWTRPTRWERISSRWGERDRTVINGVPTATGGKTQLHG